MSVHLHSSIHSARRRRAVSVRAVVPCHAHPIALAMIGLVAAAVWPMTAHAQLGKLKKLGEQVAKEAVAEKVGVHPDAAANGSGASASRGSSVVEISDERIGLVLAALAPQVDGAKRVQAQRAEEKQYATRRAAFEACLKKQSDNGTATFDPANFERAGKINERLMPMMERSATLAQSPARKREALFLADSMAVLSMQSQAAMVGATCGVPPYRPAASIDAEVARSRATEVTEAQEHGPVTKWSVPASQRGGMTTAQFGLLRERIALWTLIQSGSMQANGAKFSEAEVAALTARAGELKALAPLFLDGSLTWARWHDLTTW